jgi:dihydroorotate dehydrogenase
MAWRASVRARALPTSRLAQRPSVFGQRAERLGVSRYASDSAAPATEAAKEAVKDTAKEIPRKAGRGSKKLLYGTSLALTLLVGYIYGTDTRASIHKYGIVPLIRLLYPDAEDAHHMGVDMLKLLYPYGLHPRERGEPDSDGALSTEVRTLITRLVPNC